TATFDAGGEANNLVDLGAGNIAVDFIVLEGAVANYTIGSTVDSTLTVYQKVTQNGTDSVISCKVATSTNDLELNAAVGKLTLSGAISGDKGIKKTGATEVALTGDNSFIGTVTLEDGTLTVGHANALGNAANALSISGGTLAIGDFSPTVGTLTMKGGGSIIGTTGVLTATSYDLQDGSASAILDGVAGVVKNTDGTPGNGHVSLSGSNLFAGGITINAGTLAFGSDAAMGDAANTVTLAGGALGSSGVFATARTINVTAPGSGLSADAGKALVIDSVISAAGQSLEKTGAGAVYLAENNNIGGAGQNITLKDGKLSIYKHSALGPGATELIFDGGILEVTNGWTGGPWNLPDPATHNMTVNAGGGGIYVMPGKGFVTSGTLAGSGDLTVTGSGQLRLTGPAADFSGNIIASYALGSTGRQQIRIRDFATLDNIAGVTVESGTIFALDNDGLRITEANPGVDVGRMNNSATVTLRGGEFSVYGRNAGNNTVYETVGKAVFERGNSMVVVTRPNSTAPVTLVFSGGYERTTGAVANFNDNNQGVLGGGANDPHILFTGDIPNVNGIIPWATTSRGGTGKYVVGATFATYDTILGVQAAASTVGVLDGATNDMNLKVNAAETLTADSNPNSIIFDSAAGGFAIDLGGNILTVNSGGIIKMSGNEVTINPGSKVVGDDPPETIYGSITSGQTDTDSELFFHHNNNNINLYAPITDNGTGKVTLVKTGGGRLRLYTASSYSGGTFLNGYECLQLQAAGATGSGLVTARQSTWIDYAATGAAPGGIKLEDTSRIFMSQPAPDTETFWVGPNACITGTAAGMFINLTYGTNLFVELGGTMGETVAGTVAQIKNLPTDASMFFGIHGTVNGPETVSVGPGTPWMGLSTSPQDNGTLKGGTINPTGDFILRGAYEDSDNRKTLILGTGGLGANEQVNIVTADPVTVTLVGRVSMKSVAANYANVTFVVGADSEILVDNFANVFGGSGVGNPATLADKVIILAGGTLNPNGAKSLNAPIEVMPDGRMLIDDRAMTGAGAITWHPRAIIESNKADALTGQFDPSTIPAGVILRARANYPNVSSLDPGIIYEAWGGNRTLGSDLTLNGGMLMQDGTNNRTISGAGRIVVPSGGTATIAATTGQKLLLGSSANHATEGQIYAPGATINIGTAEMIDGFPRQGNVRLRGVVTAQTMNVNCAKIRTSQAGNSFWGADIENAASNILGDINVNGGCLYLAGGGESDGTGIMSARLTDTSGLPENRVAGRIILNAGTHTEMGIDSATPVGLSGRIEITQPFVLTGAVFPTDTRAFYITRTGAATTTDVTLMDVTLNPGGEFAAQESNVSIRYSVKLNSIGTVSGDGMVGDLKIRKHGDVEPIDILRDPGLAPFDVDQKNYAVVQWGTEENGLGGRPIYGTLGEGVWVNMVDGTFQFQAGSMLKGVIDTRTVPVNGDSFVRLDGGRDGNVADRITQANGSTGMVILGVNQNNGTEDMALYVDEVATGNDPITNQTDLYIRVAADAISTNTDGQLRAQRGNDLDVGGYGIFTNVHPDAGARTELISQDNQTVVADLILDAGSSELNATGDMRYVRDVTGTGAETLTVVGSGNMRMIGPMAGVDLVINSTGGTTYLTSNAYLGTSFQPLNGKTILGLGTGNLEFDFDLGTGTLDWQGGGRIYSMFNIAPDAPAWGEDLTIKLGGKSWFFGRVQADPDPLAGEPRSGAGQFNGAIIINADGDVADFDAYLSSSRSGAANTVGCQYTFNNVQVADGATVVLDQDNARMLVNFNQQGGAAGFVRDNDDGDICIGGVRGSGTITIQGPLNGNRTQNLVGVIETGTTLEIDDSTSASAYRLRGASIDWPGAPGFEIDGGTLQITRTGTSYFAELWPDQQIGNGTNDANIIIGKAGVTATGGLEVRYGDDGLDTAFGPKAKITLQYGGALRGFVQQGVDTAVTQVINAPITVTDADADPTTVDGVLASSKSDKPGSTQGSLIGTVQFQDVTLYDGARIRVDALNVRGTEAILIGGPGFSLTVDSGKAAVVNNSSDTLVTIENIDGVGTTLVLAGTRLTQIKGTVLNYGLQIGEGWTDPVTKTGALPGGALILPTADLTSMGAGGLDVWANGDLRLALAFNEMLTVREGGAAYAYQAFNPATLVLEKDSNLILLADGTFPAGTVTGAANIAIGKLNFTGTLVLNTGAGDGAKIGVYGADASINDPIATGAAGAATVKFLDGSTAAYAGSILSLGDGVDPDTKVMLADLAGTDATTTAVVIDRNMLILNKSTYTGGTTIDSSGTTGTSGASDNTVVVAHKNGLGTGDVTLQAVASPALKTTLSLCAADFALGVGNKIVVNERTELRINQDTDVKIELAGGTLAATGDVALGG
ncbi:MAG: hypothetical protein IMZ44_25515, partial [Planctomycetes bacterium]|nr:hypothetical protein [Planctomycetota bacterium]